MNFQIDELQPGPCSESGKSAPSPFQQNQPPYTAEKGLCHHIRSLWRVGHVEAERSRQTEEHGLMSGDQGQPGHMAWAE